MGLHFSELQFPLECHVIQVPVHVGGLGHLAAEPVHPRPSSSGE